MAKPISGLLQILASKANLDTTNAGVQALLKADIQVEDDVFTGVEKYLNESMTLETAKHNSALVNHIKAQSLLPADTEIGNIIDAYGLTPDDDFKNEKSTYKKIGKLAALVKDAEAAKAKATGGDKAALQAEIDKLNKAILDTKKQHDDAIKQIQAQAQEQVLGSIIDAHLGGKNYADSIPASIRVSGAKQLLNAELANAKAKVIRAEDGSLKLVQSDNPDLNYMVNNSPVPFDSFVDGLLAKNAMLKVSAPAPANGKGGGITIPPSDGKTIDTTAVSTYNQAQIEALQKAGL